MSSSPHMMSKDRHERVSTNKYRNERESNCEYERESNCEYDINSLPKRHNTMYHIALNEALQSKMLMRVGAVGSYNGDAVASGFNNDRTRAKKQFFCSEHAEIAVLCELLGGTHQINCIKNKKKKSQSNQKVDRRKKNRSQKKMRTDIYIVRVRQDGSVGNAKPCQVCLSALLCAGIRRVYYTTSEQTLKREMLKDMENQHLSAFQHKYSIQGIENWYF
jgi:tRNA(Arg) A34 adenosine deaminase TadA